MKKWLKFIFFSFFSHKTAKEGARRGFLNVLLVFVLALVLLWAAMVGAEMLPLGVHYGNSSDFKATAYNVFANADPDKRVEAKIENGTLKAKKPGGEYSESLLVNTFDDEEDKRNYSVNGYNIVVDTRPANTLAEVEAYCVSNDGKNTEISYEDYLTLSDVARLNFDFKLRYTGNALELTDEDVAKCLEYVNGLGEENKAAAEGIAHDLADAKITGDEYNRKIYELYFKNYYPEITAYESTSAVPLLRNYYLHKYVNAGSKNYLFVFDDYMTGSFEAKGGAAVTFHGFYSNLENGDLISEGATQNEAKASVDGFIISSFNETLPLNIYIHVVNIFTLVPFIALMLLVAALLTYSIMKLRGVESISSFGSMLKIVGSFVLMSGVISAIVTVVLSFFVSRNFISALLSVTFFVALAARSVVFAIMEIKSYTNQLEQEESEP